MDYLLKVKKTSYAIVSLNRNLISCFNKKRYMIHLTNKCIIYIMKMQLFRIGQNRMMKTTGDIIAQKLHEVVLNGRLGLHSTFDIERDKNKALRRKYKVNDTKMREILLEINGSHYLKKGRII